MLPLKPWTRKIHLQLHRARSDLRHMICMDVAMAGLQQPHMCMQYNNLCRLKIHGGSVCVPIHATDRRHWQQPRPCKTPNLTEPTLPPRGACLPSKAGAASGLRGQRLRSPGATGHGALAVPLLPHRTGSQAKQSKLQDDKYGVPTA